MDAHLWLTSRNLSRGRSGRTTCLIHLVGRLSDARLALATSVAVIGGLAKGEKRLACDAGRIVDPAFLRPGVAAIGLSLLDHLPARLLQPGVDFVELVLALDLNAKVIETGSATARRNGEIHARIVEHPFGVVPLDDGRFGREQRGIEVDRSGQIIDRDVDMHAFHNWYSLNRFTQRPARSPRRPGFGFERQTLLGAAAA